MKEFRTLLHRSWELKRLLSSKASTGVIDEVYEQALKAGVLGGSFLEQAEAGACCFMCRRVVLFDAYICYEPEEYKCD